ncbi:MAG: FimV/HubP family polar landmark protein [Betaproteobacteria bacterium]
MTAAPIPLQPLRRAFWGLRWPLLARAAVSGCLAVACLLGHGAASALGLGRLSVQSFQGEPLSAQIQVTSLTPAEQASLNLRVASPQVHQSAGLPFDQVLSTMRAALVRQPDGSFVVQLTSDRPASNLYIDLILEARWAAGQRLMGYTLLVSPAGAPPPPLAQVNAVVGAAEPAKDSATPITVSPQVHLVKSGETLSELAQQFRPEGVSLDQMLVALFRANPQAFMGENMNRLKTGAVLSLPGGERAKAVPPVPARELIEAHSADFGAYRSRLATKVQDAATEPSASRQASGQVQARVQDRKDGAAPAPDQLKLSQGGVKAASSPEEALSRQAAAREAAQREAELARNVQALKQLQQMAGASAVAAGGGTPAASTAASSSEAASGPAVGPTVAVNVPGAASSASTVTAASAASAAASAASGVALAAMSEPSWLQLLLESPYTVPAAAALVMLMALWGGYRLWRGRRDAGDDAYDAQTAAEHGDDDLRDAVEPSFEPEAKFLNRAAIPGDLDPVAEADAHLAAGSDEHAAAMLRSAIEQRPYRLDLRIKLLEVLALQRDSVSYEPLALEVQQMTNDQGSMWEHVKAMGRDLDPYNPLYGAKQMDLAGYESTQEPAEASFDADGEPADPAALDLDLNGDSAAPGMPALDAEATPSDMPQLDLDSTPSEGEELDPNAYANAEDADKAAEPDLGGDLAAEASPAPEYEAVDAEKFSIDLGEAADREASSLDEGVASEFVRPAIDLPQVDLADEAAEAPDSGGAVLPPPPDLNHPLERKMALAKEFLEIGDLEGARDLLDEVYAQATGPLKDSASLMLDTLE